MTNLKILSIFILDLHKEEVFLIKSKNKITILNILSTLILQGLAFFTGPVFSSLLGTSNFGISSVYLTWVQLASTVFSLQAASTVAIARSNFPMDEQEKYQSSTLSLSTLAYLAFSVITLVAAVVSSIWYRVDFAMLAVGLLHGWGMYCITVMNSKFTYEFCADKNFILTLLTSVLSIALSIILIIVLPDEINYWGRILGQAIIYFAIGLFLYCYMLNKGRMFYSKQYWTFTLPIAIPTIFHILANILLSQSDKVMIQWLRDDASTGVYALACTFAAVLSSVWSALNNSWVPFYYEYTRRNEISELKRHSKNYIEMYTIVSMGFILLSREVFHIYAHDDFWVGTDLIPVFALGFYFVFLYSFPVNYEFYHKSTKMIASGTILAAVCNIILNFAFIKLWGIEGAVIATATAHFLQFCFHFVCAKMIKNDEFPYKFKTFIPGTLMVFLSILIYWFTRDLWLIRWGLGAILGLYLLIKIFKRKEIF